MMSFNPLIQVFGFNLREGTNESFLLLNQSFNPLIQVFGFNSEGPLLFNNGSSEF